MALATLTTTDNTTLRVDAATMAAVEEVTAAASRLHLTSGKSFMISGTVAAIIVALGL